MKEKIKETRAQWDDVPAKVVGKRKSIPVNLESGEGFLKLGKDMGIRFKGRPKGVFRYKSFEEAER